MSAHVDSAETRRLLVRIRSGDLSARSELLRRHDGTIRRSVGRRLDTKTRSRFDTSDVVQETQLDVIRRLDETLKHGRFRFVCG